MRRFLLTLLLALLFLPAMETSSEAAVTFLDVTSSHRAYEEINFLAEGKIANGDADGYFQPNRQVTRAEAAAMIGRALSLNGAQRTTAFSDVEKENFASGYIQSAVDRNIISGYSNGTFKPNNPVTRGEMALLVSRAFNYENKTSVIGAAEALMNRGIAQGITSTDFGYNLNIIRADFSIFLARAIDYKLRTNPSITTNGELYVIADSLNIRKGPSTNYAVVSELIQGSKVEPAYKVGSWIYIKSAVGEGFVHGDYLNAPYKPGDITPPANPLSLKTIVIDPGHGGSDPGAGGFGIWEKDVVLDTGLKLKSLLSKTPFKIMMTRETDIYMSPRQKAQFANNAKADLFVSIHANAYNGSANGTETYYYNSAVNQNGTDSRLLAESIQKRMLTAWKLYDRKVKHGDFQVLRETTMPAVLVELGFIDNKTDNEKLASDYWRQKAAEAIYFGILDYYKAKGFNVASYY